MSLKRATLRAGATAHPLETLVNNTESYNGCSVAWKIRTQTQEKDAALEAALRQDRARIEARFWAKVDRTAGCWLWTASTIRGYGQFTICCSDRQRHFTAHRVAWMLAHGRISDDLCVLHRCDTPRCVNPAHLFLGTVPDNLNDARQKGRLIDGLHCRKVSDEGIAHILATYRPRVNGKALAAQYGITLVSLCRIVAGTQRVERPPVFERVATVPVPVRGEITFVSAERAREIVQQASV